MSVKMTYLVERNNTVATDNLFQNPNKKHPYFRTKIGSKRRIF